MNDLGLYIHVPFCVKKCKYCDFYSVENLSLSEAYANAVCREILSYKEKCREYCVDSIYFGGGTPSLLPSDLLSKIMSSVRSAFCVSNTCEITLECNPDSVTYEKCDAWRKAGINRISMGMQSSFDSTLSMLGRVHDISEFRSAYDTIRQAGFNNVSVDLIYGTPGSSYESVRADIDYILSLDCEHVSCYMLKVEDGTPFSMAGVECIGDDEAYEQYSLLSDLLQGAGYDRYEISNFAKAGKRSRHNMKYWTCKEYIGFGPAAYSYFKNIRYGHSRDISAYIKGNYSPIDVEHLCEDDKREEKIMLGLRLQDGVDKNLLDDKKVKLYVDNGFMFEHDGKVAFTTKGFFVSNTIIAELM